MNQQARIFRFIIVSFYVAILATACQTTRTPLAAIEALYSTDKSQSVLLEDLKNKLTENKYEMKTFDVSTGFLVTKPRAFSVNGGSKKANGRQTVQIRQENGSLKVRSIYECEYEHNGVREYEPCIIEDEAVTQKIQRVDALLQKLIKDNLNKHAIAP